MPGRVVGVTDQSISSSTAAVRTAERADPTIVTTTTADPGTGGLTLAITSAALFPPGNGYLVEVVNSDGFTNREWMLVTAGAGTTSWTVTRAQRGTAAVAHPVGSLVREVGVVQYIIPIRTRVVSGVYLTSFLGTIAAAADTPPAGRWWLINPVGSAVLVALRRVGFMAASGSALATPTSPRITLRRFSFTGTATGASAALAKGDSTSPAPVGSFRTANTGMTITSAGDFCSFLPSVALTAVGAAPATSDEWNPEDDGMPVLAAGEGVMCYQQDAGTTADTRRWITNVAAEEFTLP